MRCSMKSSPRRNRERRMLIVSTSCSILTAAIGKEAGAFIDALQARRMLPDDETPLNPRAIAIVALALVSGEEPAKAPSAALRLAEYQLTGHTERCDQPGGAAMPRRLAARLPMR